MAKVKVKNGPSNYVVTSKNLNQAINRAELIIQVVGQNDVKSVNAFKTDESSRKWTVEVLLW